METYLVYHVDNSLGIFSTETSDQHVFVIVRENGCGQRDALMLEEGRAGQLLPGWRVRAICGRSDRFLID